jgi:hypothetical protein
MPRVNTFLSATVSSLSVVTENQSATISSLALTEGFEELFTEPDALSDNGWEITGDPDFRIENGELFVDSTRSFGLKKHRELSSCEFAVNIRSIDGQNSGEFGIVLRDETTEILRFAISYRSSQIIINEASQNLPSEVALSTHHQLRVIKVRDRAHCYFDDVHLDTIALPDTPVTASVVGDGVRLGIEMIRLTAI